MYIVIVVSGIILIGSIWASFVLTKYLKKRTAEAMSLFQEKRMNMSIHFPNTLELPFSQ